jgi:hypothetical protein
VKKKVWGRLDRGWKGLRRLSKALLAVAWYTGWIVLGPFLFIGASNTLFRRSIPLTLWMPMSVMAVIITVVGLAARRGADLKGKA